MGLNDTDNAAADDNYIKVINRARLMTSYLDIIMRARIGFIKKKACRRFKYLASQPTSAIFVVVAMSFIACKVRDTSVSRPASINFDSVRRLANEAERELTVKVQGNCAGFFLKNDNNKTQYVATALHCLSSLGESKSEIEQACLNDKIELTNYKNEIGRCHSALFVGGGYDLVVLQVAFPTHSNTSVSLPDFQANKEVPLKTIGYPVDIQAKGRLVVSYECQLKTYGVKPNWPNQTYISRPVALHNCSFWGGNSGGPVIYLGTDMVVGINSHGYRNVDERYNSMVNLATFTKDNRKKLRSLGFVLAKKPNYLDTSHELAQKNNKLLELPKPCTKPRRLRSRKAVLASKAVDVGAETPVKINIFTKENEKTDITTCFDFSNGRSMKMEVGNGHFSRDPAHSIDLNFMQKHPHQLAFDEIHSHDSKVSPILFITQKRIPAALSKILHQHSGSLYLLNFHLCSQGRFSTCKVLTPEKIIEITPSTKTIKMHPADELPNLLPCFWKSKNQVNCT